MACCIAQLISVNLFISADEILNVIHLFLLTGGFFLDSSNHHLRNDWRLGVLGHDVHISPLRQKIVPVINTERHHHLRRNRCLLAPIASDHTPSMETRYMPDADFVGADAGHLKLAPRYQQRALHRQSVPAPDGIDWRIENDIVREEAQLHVCSMSRR